MACIETASASSIHCLGSVALSSVRYIMTILPDAALTAFYQPFALPSSENISSFFSPKYLDLRQ